MIARFNIRLHKNQNACFASSFFVRLSDILSSRALPFLLPVTKIRAVVQLNGHIVVPSHLEKVLEVCRQDNYNDLGFVSGHAPRETRALGGEEEEEEDEDEEGGG